MCNDPGSKITPGSCLESGSEHDMVVSCCGGFWDCQFNATNRKSRPFRDH